MRASRPRNTMPHHWSAAASRPRARKTRRCLIWRSMRAMKLCRIISVMSASTAPYMIIGIHCQGAGRVRTRGYIASTSACKLPPRHLIYGQVYAGYLVQDFTASSLGSTSNPDFGGRLIWNVTPLTTFTFGGLRTFNTGNTSTGVNGAIGPTGSGYLTTTVAANADHELRRDVLLNVNASYENDSFQGVSRTDNVYTAGAAFRYLVNRNLFLGGFYSYQQRSSSIAGLSFTQNLLTLRVGTQF